MSFTEEKFSWENSPRLPYERIFKTHISETVQTRPEHRKISANGQDSRRLSPHSPAPCSPVRGGSRTPHLQNVSSRNPESAAGASACKTLGRRQARVRRRASAREAGERVGSFSPSENGVPDSEGPHLLWPRGISAPSNVNLVPSSSRQRASPARREERQSRPVC